MTCGAACLVLARMTLDGDFARALAGPGTAGADERFAAAERTVMRRTNGWRVRGSRPLADLPWPAALGTSPWGAAAELEVGTGHRYGVRWWRHRSPAVALRAEASAVAPDTPTLLYVGSRALPRHVVLIVAAPEGPLLYEPARGRVYACSGLTGRGSDVEVGVGADEQSGPRADAAGLREAFAGWTTVWWSLGPA